MPTATQNKGLGSNLKDELDLANPNRLADTLRMVKLGTVLRAMTTRLWRKAPQAAGGFQLATLQRIPLPDDAKGSAIFRAYARAATAGQGELTVVAYGVTPATGQVAVAPNGDLVTLATDAITDLDVEYLPTMGDVKEITVNVVANVATIPVGLTAAPAGVTMLLEAQALLGTVSGNKSVLGPGAGAPVTGQARLNLAKTTVTFATADAVTSARLKLIVVPAVILDTNLATDPFGREFMTTDGQLR